jgi:hypothetical protein
MKKQAFIAFTMMSLFVAAAIVTAYAQSDARIVANIPFEFAVGDKVMPAGEYTVRHLSYNCLLIRSGDSSTALVFSTNRTRAATTPNESVLVFNRYADQYFLSKVWTSGNDIGRELGQSRAERELIRGRAASANTGSERQLVPIIAHR